MQTPIGWEAALFKPFATEKKLKAPTYPYEFEPRLYEP